MATTHNSNIINMACGGIVAITHISNIAITKSYISNLVTTNLQLGHNKSPTWSQQMTWSQQISDLVTTNLHPGHNKSPTWWVTTNLQPGHNKSPTWSQQTSNLATTVQIFNKATMEWFNSIEVPLIFMRVHLNIMLLMT